MTRRLAFARDEARNSHRQLEEQRTHLEAVLSRLSSGVLTTGHDGTLVTFNQMAEDILDAPLEKQTGMPLYRLNRRDSRLAPFARAVGARIAAARPDWREEVEMEGRHGRQILMCRGTVLPGSHGAGPGHVIVFDDVTRLIEAQRSQAWEEVARRLAHEIKNPLTPIQLSAERLRHKYLGRMEGADADSLDRLTRTIVQQVDSLKEMVNAFSRYARTPVRRTLPVDVDELVTDVAELYRGDDGAEALRLDLGGSLPAVAVDPGQFRQVLHNLIRNADEALAVRAQAAPEPTSEPITIRTRRMAEHGREFVETRVDDDGPGIPGEVMGQLFEPYVSTKVKGTGLGLAIVKKIVEEHGGKVAAENREAGGASFFVRLPAALSDTAPHTEAAATGAEHG